MTRDEAIQSLKPTACPTCGGKRFRVTPTNFMKMSLPAVHSLFLQCADCSWCSANADWRPASVQAPPEIVYADDK